MAVVTPQQPSLATEARENEQYNKEVATTLPTRSSKRVFNKKMSMISMHRDSVKPRASHARDVIRHIMQNRKESAGRRSIQESAPKEKETTRVSLAQSSVVSQSMA